MRSSVSLIRPPLGSFREALGEYRAARLHACLARLHGLVTPRAAALGARTHLRLGNPRAALARLEDGAGDSARDRGERALLRAIALSRLGDDDASRAAFADAHVYGMASLDAGLEAEVHFYLGLTEFGEGLFDMAFAACTRGLEAADAKPPFQRAGGFIPRAHVVSRLHELRGLIEAAQGRYHAQVRHARAALATLDACPVRDVYQEAFALKNLAMLARDLDVENGVEEARSLSTRVASLAWSDEISRVRFDALESLAWCAALRGDVIEALRLLRRADAVARSVPERVTAAVDRATIARELGHVPMLVEETEHALKIAAGYDWREAPGDTRLALLPLAQIAAHVSPLRAREVLDRYTATRDAIDGRFASRFESRVRAEEAFAHGLVLRSEARAAASVERFAAAFELWDAIGHAWRAARAALELAELGAGDAFTLAVRRELGRRPDSLFASRGRLVA